MNHDNKNCNSDDPRITAYIFDELAEQERQAFEREIDDSPELRNLVEETRSTVAALTNDFQLESAQGDDARCLDSQRRERLAAAFENESPVNAKPKDAVVRRFRHWRLVTVVGVAICACVTIMFWPQLRDAVDAVSWFDQSQIVESATIRSEIDAIETGVESSDMLASHIEAHPENLSEVVSQTSEVVSQTEGAESVVLFSDESIVHPPTEEWSALTEKRTKYKRVDVANKEEDLRQLNDQNLGGAHVVGGKTASVKELKMMVSPRIVSGAKDLKGRDFGLSPTNVQLFRVHDKFSVEEELPVNTGLASTVEGIGPGQGGDKHDIIVENEFLRVTDAPLSTFSIDVDTASYSKVRMYLNEMNRLPRPDAVRIEELINYFPYAYDGPEGDHPFAARQVVTECPWNPKHRLVRVAIKGKEIAHDQRPSSNLVFLLDVSGSMNQPNKLPLLKRGMKMLVDQLGENDRVAIVVYAGAAGLVLDSTSGDQKQTIVESLDRLNAGGSTNGGQGIQLAYQTALDNFIPGGTNRVVLCTDGDFNVGTTGTDQLVRIVEEQAKSNIFISVLGFGMGNHNDSMLEQISNKGNGNYAFVDTDNEAKKVLVEQLSATLVTIAKDVKIQVEFNPKRAAAYRLIGYENRLMAAQDFNDDTKDAGEIGAGHTVTAFYEVIPAGESVEAVKSVDDLKYQEASKLTPEADSDELLTLKLRYKQPEGDTSKLLEFPLQDGSTPFAKSDKEFQFAASVASFGMLLRQSEFKGNATYASVLEIAQSASQNDPSGYRAEFLELVSKAKALAGE